MTFTIQFDCSDRLEKVLTSIAEGLANIQATPSTPTPRTRKPKATAVQQEEVKPDPKEEAQEIEVAEPQEEEEAKPESKVVEESEPESKVEAPKEEPQSEITNADLRKVMNDCRARVLGDKANDGILKKVVNDKLREKVASFGCSTSTDLSQEQRVIFVKFCEEMPVYESSDNEPF